LSRFQSLPNNPTELEKLAHDLQIPLAFTYRAYGIDAAGKEITVAAPEAPRTGQIIDLMQALKQSIEKAKPKQKAAPAQHRAKNGFLRFVTPSCSLVAARRAVG
jgi:hypothetical protein